MAKWLSQEWFDEQKRLAADQPERPGATARMQYVIKGYGDEPDVSYYWILEDGKLVGKDDPKAQTRHILESIRSVLEAGGAKMSDVAYNMIFIKRADCYAPMNEVYKEFFPGTPPARFCIICELVKPEFLVEISSIAHKR